MSKVKECETDYAELLMNDQPIKVEIKTTNDFKEVQYKFTSEKVILPETFAAALMVIAKELCEIHGVVVDTGGPIEFESDGHTH